MHSIFSKAFYLTSTQNDQISLFEKPEDFEHFQLRMGLHNLCQNTVVYPAGKDSSGHVQYNSLVSPHSKSFYDAACLQFCNDSENEEKCSYMMQQIAAYFCEPSFSKSLEITNYKICSYDETNPQKQYIYYKCPFVDLHKFAFPIYVNGIAIAVLFTGQFFISSPQKSYFNIGLTSRHLQSSLSLSECRRFDSYEDMMQFANNELLDVVKSFSQKAQKNLFKQWTKLLLSKIEEQISCMEDEITAFLINMDEALNPGNFEVIMRRRFWELVFTNLKPYLESVGVEHLLLFMDEPSATGHRSKTTYCMQLHPELNQNIGINFKFHGIDTETNDKSIYTLDEDGNQINSHLFQHQNNEVLSFIKRGDVMIQSEKLQPFAAVVTYSSTAQIIKHGFMRRKVLEHLEVYFSKVGQKLAYLSSRLSEQINKSVLRIYRHEIVHQIAVLDQNNWSLDIKKLRTIDENKLRHIAEDQRQCIFELDFITQNINILTGKISTQSVDIDKNQLIDVNSSIINKAISLYQRAKRDKSIWFSIQNHSSSSFIKSNQSLLDMIFFNLMSNAIKYAYQGSKIIIGFEDTGYFSRPNKITLTDFGASVAATHHDQVFEMYFRGDTTAQVEGSGIGLYIAHEVANILNATLSWDSKKISDYNIPILMRYLHLSPELRKSQNIDFELAHAEYQRLQQNEQLNQVFNAAYLDNPDSWNLYEIQDEITSPTHKVTFTLEL